MKTKKIINNYLKMSSPQSPAIEMYQKDIEELEKLINIAIRPNIKRQLIEYKNNLSNLMNEEKKKLEAEKKKEETKSEKSDSTNDKEKSTSEVDPSKLSTSLLFTTISKYAFDTSNEKYIKLYLTDGFEGIKTFNSSNIKSKFTKTSFDVCVVGWKSKNYRFSCFNLNKDINPSDSYVKQTNSGLIVYLAKANKSDFWDSLEKKKGLFGNKDEDKEGGLDKNKDPNASLMEMMRDMYQNGDPEMKRMIAEAWTKSRDEQENKHKHEHDHNDGCGCGHDH